MLRNLNRSFSGRRIAGTSHVGVLAAVIPTTGDYPALGLNDIDDEDPADCEYRVQILTWPAVGTLLVAEDTSFTFEPPNANFVGVVGGTQRVWKSGVAVYDETYSFTYGDAVEVSADLAVSYAVSAFVSSSLVAAYSVTQLVVSDLNVGYGISQLVGADLVGGYSIETLAGQVSAELFCSYAVHMRVTADLNVTYAIGVVPVSAFMRYTIAAEDRRYSVRPDNRTYNVN